MSATRTAVILLAFDAAAIWTVLVALLHLLLSRRHHRATPDPFGPQRPAQAADEATVPTAVDPWGDATTVEAYTPAHTTALSLLDVLPTWAGPTAVLPRLERRRVIRHRNDPPAAAEAPPGRYVELLITRRA